VFLSPLDVVLSYYDVVEPDLLFIAGDQAGIMTEKNIQGAPALVVEVLSKSTRKRDAQTKRRLFERTGVREYWLVDPELDTVQIFRPSADKRLSRVEELSAELLSRQRRANRLPVILHRGQADRRTGL
jgi:Uma2 family endonuclease